MTITPAPQTVTELPTSQYLILEVLAARSRLGEACWTFPTRCHPALRRLEARGLVTYKSGVIEHTLLAWFTDKGRALALSESYTPPILR